MGAAACGNSGPSEGALAGKTATAVTAHPFGPFTAAVGAVFHQDVVGKDHHAPGRCDQRVRRRVETVTTNGVPVIDAVVVDHVAYVRTTQAVLEQTFSLPAGTASSYSGKWISLSSGDAGYQAW